MEPYWSPPTMESSQVSVCVCIFLIHSPMDMEPQQVEDQCLGHRLCELYFLAGHKLCDSTAHYNDLQNTLLSVCVWAWGAKLCLTFLKSLWVQVVSDSRKTVGRSQPLFCVCVCVCVYVFDCVCVFILHCTVRFLQSVLSCRNTLPFKRLGSLRNVLVFERKPHFLSIKITSDWSEIQCRHC